MDLVPFAVAVGVPVLALLFFFEGMLIGKVLQAPWVFVAYVTVAEPGPVYTAVAVGACVIGATAGQVVLYRGFHPDVSGFVGERRRVPYLDAVPGIVHRRIPDRTLEVLARLFDRHGALAITTTNALPIVRGLLTIPAGVSRYPRRSFVVASTVGNLAYVLLYLAIAYGLLEVLRVVAGG